MKLLNILIGLLFIGITVNAQEFNKSRMDSLFSIIEQNEKGMGSISLFQDGKEVYNNTYGYANLENKTKPLSTTKYRIGSITKTFTATIIMKLVEDGKLSLSTTLSNYYPQINNSEKITIRNLLQHRSGIFNFTSSEKYEIWHTQKHSKVELLEKIVAGGSSFEPDSNFGYSNSNYVLLTFIAEDVTGKTISELLHNYIIKPCHLQNTGVSDKINDVQNHALSYKKMSGWELAAESDMSFALGAGFISSTPYDLNVFLTDLFAYKIINQESLNEMMTTKNRFGLGLVEMPFYEMKGYGHTGGIDGFQSMAIYFPEQRIAITILSNGVSYALNDIIIGALSIYFGKDYQLPEFTEEISLTPEELEKYLGVYSLEGFPLKITITREDNILIAQGTAQPSFPLACFEKDKFKFDQAKVILEFVPEEGKMTLKQNGMTFEMKKE